MHEVDFHALFFERDGKIGLRFFFSFPSLTTRTVVGQDIFFTFATRNDNGARAPSWLKQQTRWMKKVRRVRRSTAAASAARCLRVPRRWRDTCVHTRATGRSSARTARMRRQLQATCGGTSARTRASGRTSARTVRMWQLKQALCRDTCARIRASGPSSARTARTRRH